MEKQARQVEWTDKFRSQLKDLAKKHRGLENQVIDTLQALAEDKIAPGNRLTRVSGHPVYRVRIPVGARGKRGGARIVYYKDQECLWALFLYAKNQQSRVAEQDIRDALTKYVL